MALTFSVEYSLISEYCRSEHCSFSLERHPNSLVFDDLHTPCSKHCRLPSSFKLLKTRQFLCAAVLGVLLTTFSSRAFSYGPENGNARRFKCIKPIHCRDFYHEILTCVLYLRTIPEKWFTIIFGRFANRAAKQSYIKLIKRT